MFNLTYIYKLQNFKHVKKIKLSKIFLLQVLNSFF